LPNNEAQAATRGAAIEKVLEMHPAVLKAALVDDGGEGLIAYVVPDDSYLDEILGRGTAGSAVLGKWQKTFDLSQLSKAAETAPVGFNTIGWNSSYTRGTFSLDAMQEWVDNTVDDILRLSPKSLCEIGCGTGMLVMRVAPHCERYVAVDFSPVVLNRLKEQLQKVPAVSARVELMERRADNLEGLGQNSFDAVVLNSVVQYFPNAAYLTKVLENAVNIVRPGGHIYVGDVRSLPLLQVFDTSVGLFQAADELTAGELRDRIRRRAEREPELVLSPAYFLSMCNRFPKISRVDLWPLRGRADNEMTRFRYAAILHIGNDNDTVPNGEFFDWTEHLWGLDEIRSLIRQHSNQPFGIKGIRNARIEKDLAAMAILDAADAVLTAGVLRHRIEQSANEGLHPQSLFDLEKEGMGFAVYLSWAACRRDGSYDAFFVPQKLLQGSTLPAIGWPNPDASEFARLANAPGQFKIRNELPGQLMAHCNQNLPRESVPHEIILVDSVERAP
jgi:ubiquinone/menaquinone biosynthesis C-methylase UbiE